MHNVAKQQNLFGTEIDCDVAVSDNTGSEFSDPAFAVNKNAPVHRWVPWIAGFSNEFVQGAFQRHLRKKNRVLDPFAGVGTTLVEAVLAGHDAMGFEINPYAALACRIKLDAYKLGIGLLEKGIDRFEEFYSATIRRNRTPISTSPLGFRTRAEFFSPKVLQKVLVVQDFVASLEQGILRDIFSLAFAATMVSYSNYSYEPSLGRRAAAGKRDIEDYPVGQTVAKKLREMTTDIDWMSKRMNGATPAAEVINESFFSGWKRIERGSVDLIVTSPPYLNNYHYNRNTRPQLYWLGLATSPGDFHSLEQDNFGKYWQTARERERVDLDFGPEHKEILDCLEAIRDKNKDRGIYGGNGWANYAAAYFNDCHRFALATKSVLKRRGTALVVIGNNILQGVMIPTDRFLGAIAESVGLELVDIHIARATRVGNSIINSSVRAGKPDNSHQLYEAVVELRKR